MRKAEKYQLMYAEWLAGHDVRSIALKHGLSPSRVAEVLDGLRADDSWFAGRRLVGTRIV